MPFIRPNRRKRFGKPNNALVLGAFPHLAKARVIAVLFASLGVPARRLNVSLRKRTDPDVRPRRRDGQCLDAPEHVGFGQSGPIYEGIKEAFS